MRCVGLIPAEGRWSFLQRTPQVRGATIVDKRIQLALVIFVAYSLPNALNL